MVKGSVNVRYYSSRVRRSISGSITQGAGISHVETDSRKNTCHALFTPPLSETQRHHGCQLSPSASRLPCNLFQMFQETRQEAWVTGCLSGLVKGPEWLWACHALWVCHVALVAHGPATLGARRQKSKSRFYQQGRGTGGASVMGDGQRRPPHQHAGPLRDSNLSYLTSGLHEPSEQSQEQALACELEQSQQRR